MVPGDLRDFFLASAGVAGALIGLLFVAMTVAGERLTAIDESSLANRIRASAALTAFTNALAVSLFALLPGRVIGPTAMAVAVVGLLFVIASLMALVRLRRSDRRSWRDAAFLVGLVILLLDELLQGWRVTTDPADAQAVKTIAVIVAVSFLVGIGRAWELVGGPSFGVRKEIAALVRARAEALGPDGEPEGRSGGRASHPAG